MKKKHGIFEIVLNLETSWVCICVEGQDGGVYEEG